MQATDQTPPTLPVIPAPLIHHAVNSDSNGCGGSKCSDVSRIEIPAVATDDMTPPEKIGYRVTLESGHLPPNEVLPADAIEPIGGFVELYFTSGTTFNATLKVVAIDLAGNESAPQSVHVNDIEGMPCSAAGGPASRSGPGCLALAALLLVARRRRRRPKEALPSPD